jgi:glycine oxidase
MDLLPVLGAALVLGSWSSFRPYIDDRLPLLGAAAQKGLFVATGHFRNGILLTPITADLLADLILLGEAPIDLRPFSATRAPFTSRSFE